MANIKSIRPRLDEEELHWIVTSLRSMSRAGRQASKRRVWLQSLAERLEENRAGNPNLIFNGRLTPETSGASD